MLCYIIKVILYRIAWSSHELNSDETDTVLFIRYGDLYSASSRLLLRSAPKPCTAKKKSFEAIVKCVRTNPGKQLLRQRQPSFRADTVQAVQVRTANSATKRGGVCMQAAQHKRGCPAWSVVSRPSHQQMTSPASGASLAAAGAICL